MSLISRQIRDRLVRNNCNWGRLVTPVRTVNSKEFSKATVLSFPVDCLAKTDENERNSIILYGLPSFVHTTVRGSIRLFPEQNS